MTLVWQPYTEVHETHIGVVFLLGDHAYKLKKPVTFPFIDCSTVQLRRSACRREVELNRRLSPDVYLGLTDLSSLDDQPPEPVVVMRRMPEDRRLARLVASGVPLEDEMRQLARSIAAFHSTATRSAEISTAGSQQALHTRWSDNIAEMRKLDVLDADLIARIERLAVDFVVTRDPLFDQRIATGRVLDGHGDLLAADIFCLDDGPRVLDCIEFDDRYRWLDGLDDICFLAMDLEYLGASDLAGRLLDHYATFAGDPAPSSLRHHYVAYRAFVRAKVFGLRARQGDGTAAEEARGYAGLALRHLRAGEPRLILVGGLPGTGKTTVAGAVADHLGGVVVSSDRVRKELLGLSAGSAEPSAYGEGMYSAEHSRRTYGELLRRAEKLLTNGETVVLDASWTRARDRADAADIARGSRSRLVAVQCHAPARVAAERMRTREHGWSDATAPIATAMAVDADPWPQAHVIDTTRSLAQSRDDVVAACA